MTKHLFTFLLLISFPAAAVKVSLNSQGVWITEQDGQAMANPQPSGLVYRQGELWFISDRSADERQRQKIHRLDAQTGALRYPALPIRIDAKLRDNCFYAYLADNPDYEAMVLHPDNDEEVILVTEDMTYQPLEGDCQQRWSATGSAAVPFLLLRAKVVDGELVVDGVRPLQFNQNMAIGAFANDGIEGLAMTPQGVLYLALEKDSRRNPRIFSLQLDEQFWQTQDFAVVDEPELQFPQPGDGMHPLNAMQYVASEKAGHPGYLAAFARNIDQLWLIDLTASNPALIIPIAFWAPTASDACPAFELMDNASIEGLALDGDRLYLINDPWKLNYKKNIQCESNREAYSRYAPLLFNIRLDQDWMAK